jgi:hypothetical protein
VAGDVSVANKKRGCGEGGDSAANQVDRAFVTNAIVSQGAPGFSPTTIACSTCRRLYRIAHRFRPLGWRMESTVANMSTLAVTKDAATGLTSREAAVRLQRDGPNAMPDAAAVAFALFQDGIKIPILPI